MLNREKSGKLSSQFLKIQLNFWYNAEKKLFN